MYELGIALDNPNKKWSGLCQTRNNGQPSPPEAGSCPCPPWNSWSHTVSVERRAENRCKRADSTDNHLFFSSCSTEINCYAFQWAQNTQQMILKLSKGTTIYWERIMRPNWCDPQAHGWLWQHGLTTCPGCLGGWSQSPGPTLWLSRTHSVKAHLPWA